MMSHVAPVLPALLVTAALAAQFSAAVADTAGAGGLVSEQSKGRFSPRFSYVLLVVAGLVLTWALDVFAIIAFASRAFAIYYALQAVIAAYEARKTSHFWALGWLCLALLAISMAVFGRSVE